MAGGEGGKKWDATAERDLSMAIIVAGQNGPEGRGSYNWPQTHEIMKSIGYAFTKDAMSQHFTKVMLKDFKTRHPDSLAAATPASTPKKPAGGTPAKRKTPAGKTPKAGVKGKKADDENADGNGADGDDKGAESDAAAAATGSPRKKPKVGKREPASAKKEPKAELEGVDADAKLEDGGD
ncbi:hypothetical protein HIM_00235 [Hirsutella minnesotensis 3608]|nr:hypothetical protein HIM_00235 [Hirsutella minnesotensis 3608]